MRIKSWLVELVRFTAPLLILGAAVLAYIFFGQRPAPAKQERTDSAPLVETAAAVLFDGSFTLEADGVAVPIRRMTLSAEVDGRIISRTEQAVGGRALHTGSLLFEIDPTDHELTVRRLAAQLKQSDEELNAVDVELASTKALLEIARQSWKVQQRSLDRLKELAEDNAISESELDEGTNAELTARNSFQSMENRLAELKQKKKTRQAARDLVSVQHEEAQRDLQRTKVVSPIEATVILNHVEENDFVRRGDPLAEISDNSKVEVRCSLLVEQIFWIWLAGGNLPNGASESSVGEPPSDVEVLRQRFEIPSLPVRVLYDFGGGPVAWSGVLSRYEGTGLDEKTRSVPCRILIDNPDNPVIPSGLTNVDLTRTPPRLFSGMFVGVEIPIRPPIDLLQLPEAALRAGSQVWVVRDEAIQIEDVNVARREDGYILIHPLPARLEAGDRVVVSPLAAAETGMRIQDASSLGQESTDGQEDAS